MKSEFKNFQKDQEILKKFNRVYFKNKQSKKKKKKNTKYEMIDELDKKTILKILKKKSKGNIYKKLCNFEKESFSNKIDSKFKEDMDREETKFTNNINYSLSFKSNSILEISENFETKKNFPEKFETKKMISKLEKIVKNFKTGTFSEKIYFRERERKEIEDFIIKNFFFKEKDKDLLSTIILFGQSGLGKTLLINDILKNLKNIIQNYENKLLPKKEQKNKPKKKKKTKSKNNSVQRKRNKSKSKRKLKKSKSSINNKNSSSSQKENKNFQKNICSIFLNANNFNNCDLFLTEIISKIYIDIKKKKKK